MNDIQQDAAPALEPGGRKTRRTPVTPTPQTELALAPAAAAPVAQGAKLRTTMTPMDMLAIAVERGASVDELGKLWDIAEKVRMQQAQQAFVGAMTRFKQDPPTIQKTRAANVTSKKGEGASYAYKFANLADVCNGVIKALSEVGISHSWASAQDGGQITVRCTITHELGHSQSTQLTAGLDTSGGKNNLQALGSTRTYLERYTLLDVCGLAVDDELDDDGAGATDVERKELQGAAAEMRAGASAAPASPLLQQGQQAADKGHTAFGAFWRGITEDQRRTLAPALPGLQQRASSAKVK